VSDLAVIGGGSNVAEQRQGPHDQANTTLQNLLQSVEGAPTEQLLRRSWRCDAFRHVADTALLLKTSLNQLL